MEEPGRGAGRRARAIKGRTGKITPVFDARKKFGKKTKKRALYRVEGSKNKKLKRQVGGTVLGGRNFYPQRSTLQPATYAIPSSLLHQPAKNVGINSPRQLRQGRGGTLSGKKKGPGKSGRLTDKQNTGGRWKRSQGGGGEIPCTPGNSMKGRGCIGARNGKWG